MTHMSSFEEQRFQKVMRYGLHRILIVGLVHILAISIWLLSYIGRSDHGRIGHPAVIFCSAQRLLIVISLVQ
jgi:hypothetical protein